MSISFPSESSIRTTLAIVGVLCAFVAPWWVPAVCIVLLAIRYPAWEALVIGFIIDLMWLPADFLYNLPVALLLSALVVWGCGPLRDQFLRS